jgi:hypothetical protein
MAAETKRKAVIKPPRPKATKAATKGKLVKPKGKLAKPKVDDDDGLLDSRSSPDDIEADDGDDARSADDGDDARSNSTGGSPVKTKVRNNSTWGGTLGSPVKTWLRRQTDASDEEEAKFGGNNDMPNNHFIYAISEGPAAEDEIKAKELDLESAHTLAKTCSVKIGTRIIYSSTLIIYSYYLLVICLQGISYTAAELNFNDNRRFEERLRQIDSTYHAFTKARFSNAMNLAFDNKTLLKDRKTLLKYGVERVARIFAT